MKLIVKYLLLILSISAYAQTDLVQTEYEYDNLNRLVRVISNDGTEKSYVYDDLGNRMQLNTTTLSVDTETLKNVITIYPNPTDRFIRVRFPERFESTKLSYTLFDINGKQIMSSKYSIEEQHIEVDVGNLANGVYLIHLRSGQQKWSQLIIKK